MVLSTTIGAAVVALSVATSSTAFAWQQAVSDSSRGHDTVTRFLQSVGEYLAAHPVVTSIEPDTLCLPEDAYTAAAVQLDVRPPAREGEIFAPEVADLFRHRIAEARHVRGRQALRPDAGIRRGPVAAGPAVAVGERLPAGAGTSAPAWLLATLPPLPPDAEYHLVASDLVLIDLRGNLVIDVLRGWRP
jgi:hypothetical protein